MLDGYGLSDDDRSSQKQRYSQTVAAYDRSRDKRGPSWLQLSSSERHAWFMAADQMFATFEGTVSSARKH